MYYYRLANKISGRSHTILNAAFSCMKSAKHPWLENVQYAFTKNGMGNLYKNIQYLKKDYVKIKIKNRLEEEYEQENTSTLENKPYLGMLYECTRDTKYGKSEYLNIIDSAHLRYTVSRLRLNCSRLSPNPYTLTKKSCTKCNVVLDWQHCLLECSLNAKDRLEYFNKILPYCPLLYSESIDKKLKTIMNLDFKHKNSEQEETLISLTLSFISKTYKSFLAGSWV